MARGQFLLLDHQVTMSEETVWQGLVAILPIFHWTVLPLGVWRLKTGMVQAEVTAPGRQDRGWVAILDQ